MLRRIKTRVKRVGPRRWVEPVFVPWLTFWARLVLRLRRPFVIGITGSAGKTTTTYVIGAVLAQAEATSIVGTVASTVHNMNNDEGLPLTVLRFESWPKDRRQRLAALLRVPFRACALAFSARYPKILVLEYAAGPHGDIRHLVGLARPDIAVVTTIGPSHLEHFATVAGVARAKSALVEGVPASGVVILGEEHEWVEYLECRALAPVLKVSGRGFELSKNIARVIGLRLGLDEGAIASVLKRVEPVSRRLNHLDCGPWSIIDDSYNANPVSMALGLDTLAEAARPGQRRVAVLGTMAELGERASEYHHEIGRHARERADVVIGVGDLARRYEPHHWFDDSEACAAQIDALLQPNDCVLVKGSNSVRMDVVVRRLQAIASSRLDARISARASNRER